MFRRIKTAARLVRLITFSASTAAWRRATSAEAEARSRPSAFLRAKNTHSGNTIAPYQALLTASHLKDVEFLPAALEILVAPPSPIALNLMGTIAAMVVCALLWSTFGWIEIYAVAPGKLQPSGRSKVVQPFETGKVTVLRVSNGSLVKAGQVLAELDPTETGADREALARDLASASAEVARRQAAVEAAADITGSTTPAINFPSGVGSVFQDREIKALQLEWAQLSSSILLLNAQIQEKKAVLMRLNASLDARIHSLDLGRERVGMRNDILTRGAGSRSLVIEAEQQLETMRLTDVGERGQLAETNAAIQTLEARIDQTMRQFSAEQMQKLIDADRKRDHLEQDMIKASSKSDRTRLVASIDGAVQQLTITTIGQVVTSGQTLMTLVPTDTDMEIEARVSNKDVAFVRLGQTAFVKLDAFPFSRFGVLHAVVDKVSTEAMDDRDAQMLADTAAVSRPQQSGVPNPGMSQNLVYLVSLRLNTKSVHTDGGDVSLALGMTGTVEIKTGERRAIDYVLSPLREMVSDTAHER